MHGRDLASDRQGYYVKRPRKNTRWYAANLRVNKLADFNDGVFFECSSSANSSERVNLSSAL